MKTPDFSMKNAARAASVVALMLSLLAIAAGSAGADVAPVDEPAPAVEQPVTVDLSAVDPVVRVAAHRRCSSRTVVITPSYTNGNLVKSVLFVNGRQMQVTTDHAARFHLGARRFKAGRNNYEIVSIFSSGKSASTIGWFKRCSRRG